MTSNPHLNTIRALYDERAPTYDNTTSFFHKRQAADYITYVNPHPGQRILDLACGTGGLTIPLAQTVFPNGIVIGVDISTVSLGIARQKAEDLGLIGENVTFLEGDVARVGEFDQVKKVIEGDGGFDVITCASALVLLENPRAAIKRWASLLKAGGRLIFDTPTSTSFISGVLLEKIGRDVGIPVPYSRIGFSAIEDIVRILDSVGLDASETFLSRDYVEEETWIETGNGKAEEEWEKVFKQKGWFQGPYFESLDKAGKLDRARNIYVRELEALGGEQGRVKEGLRFNIGIGRKV